MSGPVLESLNRLSEVSPRSRLEACATLLATLRSEADKRGGQFLSIPNAGYILSRLLKGLMSSSMLGRHGFSFALCRTLRTFEDLTSEYIVKASQKIIAKSAANNRQEKREYTLGRLSFVQVLCRSGRLRDLGTSSISGMCLEISSFASVLEVRQLAFATLLSIMRASRSGARNSVVIPAIESILNEATKKKNNSDILSPDHLYLGLQLARGRTAAEQITDDGDADDEEEEERLSSCLSKPIAEILRPKRINQLAYVFLNHLRPSPSPHPVWASLASVLSALEGEKKEEKGHKRKVSPFVTMQQVWKRVVEESFLKSTAASSSSSSTLAQRRFALQAFTSLVNMERKNKEQQTALSSSSSSLAINLLTPHFSLCLLENLSKKGMNLSGAAEQGAKSLKALAESDPILAGASLQRLMEAALTSSAANGSGENEEDDDDNSAQILGKQSKKKKKKKNRKSDTGASLSASSSSSSSSLSVLVAGGGSSELLGSLAGLASTDSAVRHIEALRNIMLSMQPTKKKEMITNKNSSDDKDEEKAFDRQQLFVAGQLAALASNPRLIVSAADDAGKDQKTKRSSTNMQEEEEEDNDDDDEGVKETALRQVVEMLLCYAFYRPKGRKGEGYAGGLATAAPKVSMSTFVRTQFVLRVFALAEKRISKPFIVAASSSSSSLVSTATSQENKDREWLHARNNDDAWVGSLLRTITQIEQCARNDDSDNNKAAGLLVLCGPHQSSLSKRERNAVSVLRQEALRVTDLLSTNINQIEGKKRTESTAICSQLAAIRCAVLHLALFLQEEPKEVTPLLTDLVICAEEIADGATAAAEETTKKSSKKKKRKQKNGDTGNDDMELAFVAKIQPHLSVLMEAVLGMLVFSRASIRKAARNAFCAFSKHLNRDIIESILQVVQTLPDDGGGGGGNDDDDDAGSGAANGGDMEEENALLREQIEGEPITIGMGTFLHDAGIQDPKDLENMEFDDDDEEEEEEEEEEEDEEEDDDDNEEEDAKEGGGENEEKQRQAKEMAMFTAHLEGIMRLRKERAKARKELRRQATHFRLRALELLDLFAARNPTHGLLALLLPSLLTVAVRVTTQKESRDLAKRAAGIIRARFSRPLSHLNIVPDPEILQEALVAVLKIAHGKKKKSGGNNQNNSNNSSSSGPSLRLAATALIFILRLIENNNRGNKSKKSKKKRRESGEAEASVASSSAFTIMRQVLRNGTILRYLTSKSRSGLNCTFCLDLINALPHAAVDLASDLARVVALAPMKKDEMEVENMVPKKRKKKKKNKGKKQKNAATDDDELEEKEEADTKTGGEGYLLESTITAGAARNEFLRGEACLMLAQTLKNWRKGFSVAVTGDDGGGGGGGHAGGGSDDKSSPSMQSAQRKLRETLPSLIEAVKAIVGVPSPALPEQEGKDGKNKKKKKKRTSIEHKENKPEQEASTTMFEKDARAKIALRLVVAIASTCKKILGEDEFVSFLSKTEETDEDSSSSPSICDALVSLALQRQKLRGAITNVLSVWPGGGEAKTKLKELLATKQPKKNKSKKTARRKNDAEADFDAMGFGDGELGADSDDDDDDDDNDDDEEEEEEDDMEEEETVQKQSMKSRKRKQSIALNKGKKKQFKGGRRPDSIQKKRGGKNNRKAPPKKRNR